MITGFKGNSQDIRILVEKYFKSWKTVIAKPLKFFSILASFFFRDRSVFSIFICLNDGDN